MLSRFSRNHPESYDVFNKSLRFFGTVTIAGALTYHVYLKLKQPKPLFGFSFRCFTIWSASVQLFYFAFGVVNDLLGVEINTFREYVGSAVAFPLSVISCVGFWSLYCCKEDWLPKDDLTIPVWLFHLLHTNALALQIVNFIIEQGSYPGCFEFIMYTTAFHAPYALWVWIVHENSDWVYPFLNDLRNLEKLMLLAGVFGTHVLIYCIQKWFSQKLWGKRHLRWSRADILREE